MSLAKPAKTPPKKYDEAIKFLARSAPELASLIKRVGPPQIGKLPRAETFDALLRSIVFQQLNGKAAATILARVQALFPDNTPTPELLLAMRDEPLRGAGLSANKLLALRDLSAKVLDGTVPPLASLRKLSDEEVVARLSAVRGIGAWTVEMLLIFRLGRLDVWPVDDFAVRKGYARCFGLAESPTPKALRVLGERFRPYRSLVAWYMWRASEEV